ncbi:MAG: hypothetical protein BM562_04325 [Alphaproteobacteria bacterium MedPE-SWcel]|nr:MAG: hypothetical protein BM562_04325 [Alphaproteobacteria bacterium MedPE-SWcel]
MQGTQEAESAEAADMLVGVVEIGGMLFAIPIADVREVIPAPTRFQRLPSQHPDLAGGVLLRGKAIPVQVLHRRLGLDAPVLNGWDTDLSDRETTPDTPAAEGVIVVVRANGRVTGVLVDAVRCLLQLGDTWAQNLPEGQDDLICGGYICDTHGHFSMLSVPELLNIPLAPSDEISETARRRSRVRRVAYIRFRVGELNFLIAMKDIASTVPTSALEPWPVSGGSCLGLISRHGMEMPMLDTLANLGFSSTGARPTEASGVIIDFPDDHALAFNVDRVVSVVNVQEDAVYAFPPSVTSRWNLFDGVHIDEAGDQCFVINVAACREDADLLRLAATSHRKKPEPIKRMAASSQGEGRGSDNASEHGIGSPLLAGIRSQSNRYLTVCAAGDFAVPIEAVSEIMRVPVQFGEADFDGHLVNLSYRDRLMPVYDCAQRRGNGIGQFGTEAGILILNKDGHHFGLAVEAMKSIDTGRLKGFRNADGTASDMPSEQLVELGLGRASRLVPVEDPTVLLP